jgi:hypothetical protein
MYVENKCFPETRIPHFKETGFCVDLEKCMASTAEDKVSFASIFFEVSSDLVNGFFENLTYKSLACSTILGIGTMLAMRQNST